jgi:hypothetical protein
MSEEVDINQYVPGFDYEKLNKDQKTACDELLRLIAEKYQDIDFGHLRTTFKLEDKKYYDLKESEFAELLKRENIVLDPQGYVKTGLGADAIHYPIVAVCADIRKFDKVLNDYKKIIVDLVNNVGKDNK